MSAEKIAFEREVAELEQWWKVCFQLRLISWPVTYGVRRSNHDSRGQRDHTPLRKL
jgi:hypothetical protein